MKKSTVAIAGATAAVLLALTACGSSDPSETTSGSVGGGAAATASGEASGDVSYWLWDSNQLPAYQACADAFHKANPALTVTISQYGWDDYWSKITNGFTSGTGPDVFTDHLSKYPEFVNKQQILSISDALEADKVDTSIYQEGLLDLWTAQDGKIYGLPKDFDTVAIFYDKTDADAAGLTAEQLGSLEWNPADGGTYEKAIAHLTVDANGVRGDEAGFDKGNVKTYGMGYENVTDGNGQTQWSPFTGSNGWTYTDENPWGNHYNYDDPKFQETLTFYRSLIEKGYMPPLDKVIGSDGGTLLGSGNYAAIINGDWNVAAYAKIDGIDLAFAPTPIGPSGKRASMFNGLADSINAGTKNQAGAIKWVEFTGSAACQELVAAEAVVFPAIPAATDKAIAAFKAKGFDLTPFTDHVTDKTTFLFPITDHAADITAVMGPAMQSFISGATDASSFTDANEQVNGLFK